MVVEIDNPAPPEAVVEAVNPPGEAGAADIGVIPIPANAVNLDIIDGLPPSRPG